MDFQRLLAKMQELDRPATESCGMDAPMSPPPLPAVPPKPETPPPSMSVNINAQGMENIEDMMKLFQRVNPDMMPKVPEPMPAISMIPPLGGMEKPINKLLPDFDADNDNMPGGDNDSLDLPPGHDQDHAMIKTLDKDSDGDHDMDDHEAEKKKEKEEEFANEPDEETADVDSVLMKGNDLHKAKGTYPKVAGGDNPMQKMRESGDLRSQIRAELLQRLAEAKGAK